MAQAVVDVLRLDIGPLHVQHVEALHDAREFLEGGERARAPATVEIADVRRAAAGEEAQRTGLQREVAGAVARPGDDRLRSGCKRRRHDVAADANHAVVFVDAGAGRTVQRPRLRQQDLQAELLEHPQRGVVDGGDPILRNSGCGTKGLRSLR